MQNVVSLGVLYIFRVSFISRPLAMCFGLVCCKYPGNHMIMGVVHEESLLFLGLRHHINTKQVRSPCNREYFSCLVRLSHIKSCDVVCEAE